VITADAQRLQLGADSRPDFARGQPHLIEGASNCRGHAALDVASAAHA